MGLSEKLLQDVPPFDFSRWEGDATDSMFTWQRDDFHVTATFDSEMNTIDVQLTHEDTQFDSFQIEPYHPPTSIEEIQREIEQGLQERYGQW